MTDLTKRTHGGARPGAGRPANPPTLLTVPDTSDPVQFMLSVMRDTTADARLRLDAAKALMPFMHIRKGGGGKKDEQQAAAQKAATGKFAPGKPPRLATISKLLER